MIGGFRMAGKILIVNKLNGDVMGWIGETSGCPEAKDIALVELEQGQYDEEFVTLRHGLDSVKVTDIENKTLWFEPLTDE